MNQFLLECARQFYHHTSVLTVLIIGAAVLLTRRSRGARAGAALLLGLLAFLVPWLLVSCALTRYYYASQTWPTPRVDGMDWGLALRLWGWGYLLVETAVVVLLAKVLRDAARDRQPPVAPTGEPEA